MKRWSVMKILVPWFVLFAVTSCGPLSLTDGNNDLAGGGIGVPGLVLVRLLLLEVHLSMLTALHLI
jgi:hypothetical protein